jgi:hypothetical protein
MRSYFGQMLLAAKVQKSEPVSNYRLRLHESSYLCFTIARIYDILPFCTRDCLANRSLSTCNRLAATSVPSMARLP